VRGQGIQHPTDDLVGHQKAPGRQVPAAVLRHRIAGLGALVQEGQKAGEPAAEAALKCLGVQTR
ncbi:Arc-like DNA binding domain-containing protein, partial [Dysosmobacter welbionis]